jgi:hypothetical protein
MRSLTFSDKRFGFPQTNRRKKMIRCSKILGYRDADTILDFQGIKVETNFCKVFKKDGWNN